MRSNPSVRGTRLSAVIAATLAAATAFTGPDARAETDTSEASKVGLEEVTVTARRRAESLQEVPIAVTAFTAEAIENRGIRNINDIAKLTPGLSFDKGFAPQDTRPNIRGLPTTRGRPPIGILLDGIDISSESIATAGGSAFMNMKLVDVERIEVVKGPQSALYGRVAFGGAINYVSKKPNVDAMEGNVLADLASDGLYEVRGAVNFPIVEGKAALRVNALYSSFDGFYDNAVSGETIGGWETKGVAAALRMTPTENADFTLRLSYSKDEGEPRPSYYFGQAVAGRNQSLPLPSNAVGLRLGVPPGGAPLPASIPYPLAGEIRAAGPVQLSVDPLTGRDFEGSRTEAFVGSLVGDVRLGWATLSSWTGYMDGESLSRADADFYGLPATAVTLPSAGTAEPLRGFSITDLEANVKQFSQELRLGNLENQGFRWAVGALYWKEDYDSLNRSAFVNGFNRSPPSAPLGWSAARELQLRGTLPGDLNYRNTTHKSAYLVAEVDVTDKLELSAEARYAKENFDYLFGRALAFPITPAGAILPVTLAGTQFRPSSDSKMFTPKVTVNYKPVDGTLLYATASKGLKPAGFLNVGVVFDANDAKYKPEELWNYELGAKTSWLDDRLRLNAAYFHMIYKDRITNLLVPDARSPQGTTTLVVNAGEAKVDGFEVELTAQLSESWLLSAAYTYLDPRFTDSEVPTVSALGIAGAGNCRVGTVGPQTVCFTNTNGRQLEQSAKHALSATLNYRRDLESGWTLNGELAAQYRSKRFVAPENTIWLASYTNVDLQLGVDNGKYGVLGYVTNVFDQDKPTSAQTYGDPFIALPIAPPVLAYTAYAADPRQYGVRLTYRF
jgi:outer membrane receptor protein involved in Fe transport